MTRVRIDLFSSLDGAASAYGRLTGYVHLHHPTATTILPCHFTDFLDTLESTDSRTARRSRSAASTASWARARPWRA